MKIKEMETEKLISLLCGDQFMNTKALPEYDIPSLEMSDGPMGLRYQKKDKDSLGINRSEPATCLPAGVAVAASWNPDVAEQVGTIIGSEAAAYGVDLVLGPAVNLERNPLCGRNVEYLSEDPLLAGDWEVPISAACSHSRSAHVSSTLLQIIRRPNGNI